MTSHESPIRTIPSMLLMATDFFVERSDVEVLRVRADMRGKGPAEAFQILESKLPSLKGRKFYGTFRLLPGGEEYYACVARIPLEDPEAMSVELGNIPGGPYVRRKILDWEAVIRTGKIGPIFEAMVSTYRTDPDRPNVEYYRSRSELHLLVPVLGPGPRDVQGVQGPGDGESPRP